MGPSTAVSDVANASHATIDAMSCTKALHSRADVVSRERSRDSFARTHGWIETCTFGGSVIVVLFLLVCCVTGSLCC